MEAPPYTVRFETKAKILLPEKNKMQEMKASISSLKNIFHKDINPEEDKDLLYIAGNLAVANQVNKNGDCVTGETVLQIYKKFEKKFIDLDHDRKKIHGYITVAGLSDYNSSELISEEEAAKIDGPFNIAIGGIIWKILNNKLAQYLIKASDENGEEFGGLSFSLELGFFGYSIAVGSGDVTKAKIYTKEKNPEEFEKYDKYLVFNKGSGKDKEGNLVYRVIDEKVIPLGAGIVVNPAADVEGITTLLEIEADDELEEDTEIQEEFMAKLQDIVKQVVLETLQESQRTGGETQANLTATSEQPAVETSTTITVEQEASASTTPTITETVENNSQLKNNSVNQHITNMPKITKAEDIVSTWDELVKHEAAASEITKFIADEIARNSETYIATLQAKETAEAELKEKTAKALADVEVLRAELDAIKQEKTAKELQAKFDERMSGFDNEYDLDNEDRQVIAKDIKDLNDESFATYCEKFKVLAKEKSKAFKTAKASAIAQELEKKGVKATVDKDLNFSEIIATAKEETVTIPAGPSSTSEESLSEKMQKAFGGDGITLNGRPIKKK